MDRSFWTDCVSGTACFLPIRQAATLSRFLQRQSFHLRTSKQRTTMNSGLRHWRQTTGLSVHRTKRQASRKGAGSLSDTESSTGRLPPSGGARGPRELPGLSRRNPAASTHTGPALSQALRTAAFRPQPEGAHGQPGRPAPKAPAPTPHSP